MKEVQYQKTGLESYHLGGGSGSYAGNNEKQLSRDSRLEACPSDRHSSAALPIEEFLKILFPLFDGLGFDPKGTSCSDSNCPLKLLSVLKIDIILQS